MGNDLYVTNADAVQRFPYSTGDTHITVPGRKVVALDQRCALLVPDDVGNVVWRVTAQ